MMRLLRLLLMVSLVVTSPGIEPATDLTPHPFPPAPTTTGASLELSTQANASSASKVVQVDLEATARRQQQLELDWGQAHQFSALNTSNQLGMELIRAEHDLMNYSTTFGEMWNNGTGDLSSFHDTTTTVSLQEGIYSNNYEVSPNNSLYGDEQLEITLEQLDFSLSNSDFGFLNLVYEFDTLRLTLVLNASDSYEDIVDNSTGDIVLLRERLGFQLHSIAELSALAGVNHPVELRNIYINSYVNTTYDLSATFSQLRMTHQISEIDMGAVILDQSRYLVELGEGEDLLLQPSPDFRAEIDWDREFMHPTTLAVDLLVKNATLWGMAEYGHASPVDGFLYYLQLDQVFSHFSLDSQFEWYNSSGFWYDQPLDAVSIKGQLHQVDHHPQYSTLRQNEPFRVEGDGSWKLTVVIHHPSNQILVVETNDSVTIPADWSRGTVGIYSVQSTANYYTTQIELELSPSALVSGTEFSFLVTQQVRIPVILQNLSSGQQQPASTVISYHNSTIRSIDGTQGILISPGEFGVGQTILQITASANLLVPITTNIMLTVEEPSFAAGIEAKRLSAEESELSLSIPELANWSVGVVVAVSGDQLDQQAEMLTTRKLILLSHPTWNASQSYSVRITIWVEQTAINRSTEVMIPGVSAKGDGEQNRPVVVVLSTVSVTGLVGSVAFKLYSLKNRDETINF